MMTRLYCNVAGFLKSEEGATAVEYGIMVALIAGAILITVTALGGALNALFGVVSTAVVDHTP